MSCPKETMTFGLFVMQNIEDFHKMLLLTLYRIAQKWPTIMTLLMTLTMKSRFWPFTLHKHIRSRRALLKFKTQFMKSCMNVKMNNFQFDNVKYTWGEKFVINKGKS